MTNRHKIGAQIAELMKEHSVTSEDLGFKQNTLNTKLSGIRPLKYKEILAIIEYFKTEKKINLNLTLQVDSTAQTHKGEDLTMDDWRKTVDALQASNAVLQQRVKELESRLKALSPRSRTGKTAD